MDKMLICRVCLVENVRMHTVNDKDLHELYETLTDIPFVTEDRRPMLACFLCFTKLKQCCQLQRKCLEAEKLFVQMLNEPNPSVNRGQLKYSCGLTVTPVENISIVDVSHVVSVSVKEELPAVCERLDDVIEPEEEHLKYELELELVNNRYSDAKDVPAQQSKPGLEYDVPLIEIKTEVEEEQEVPRQKRKASDTTQLELDNLNKRFAEDISAQQSESDLRFDVPLIEIKTEVEEEQEVLRKKTRASDTTRTAVAPKPKRYIRGKKPEDAITKNHKKNEEIDTRVTQNTQHCTSELIPKFDELLAFTTPRVNTSVIDITLDTNCRNNIKSSSLTKHTRIRTSEAPFKCDICKCSFNRKSSLTRHIRTHTDENRYKCEACLRCFNDKSSLIRHTRTHTGNKPYKCEECQLSFSQKVSLTSHIRTHTGEKPYKCEECQLCFSVKSNLLNHIRTHTGEKPFKCEECQLCFNRKSTLTRHIRLVHAGEKSYK